MTYKKVFTNKQNNVISGGSDSILAKMFNKIIQEKGINFNRWDDLINNYIRDPRNSIPNNDKDRSSERGNLRKEIFKNKISWKVFCKAMRVFNFTKFDLTITIHHQDIEKSITIHTLEINLGQSVINDTDEDIIKKIQTEGKL